MKKLSKKLSLLLLFAVCFSVGIPCLAAGTASVNLTASQNYADSAVVRCEDGETVTIEGKVLASSKKNGSFVARYQKNGNWYNDSSAKKKGVKPSESFTPIKATTGHKYFVLRIVSGNDTVGFGNTGTIAQGTIKAK